MIEGAVHNLPDDGSVPVFPACEPRVAGERWTPLGAKALLPNLLRRVGPQRAQDFGLRAQVEGTAARNT